MLLSSLYFAPISWYAAFLRNETIFIDRHENYIKQTWRNRCRIDGPNGVQDLIVPVHLRGNHTSMEAVTIDYTKRWQQSHWGAIRSAYGQSPFFEHYAETIAPFYEAKKWETLIDFNKAALETTLRLLRIKKEWSFSTEFTPYEPNDLRLSISPKRKPETQNSKPETINSGLRTSNFGLHPYTQVFSDRHEFIPNLSILDLLFCCGPASIAYLQGAKTT